MSSLVNGGASSNASRANSASLSRFGTEVSDSDNLRSRSSSSGVSLNEGSGSETSLPVFQNASDMPRPHPFVDKLCRRLELSPTQSAELHEMVKV